MAENEGRLSAPIKECSTALTDFVNSLVPEDDTNYLLKPVDFEKFSGKQQVFEDIISKNQFDYKIDVPMVEGGTQEDEKTKDLQAEIEKFNSGLDERTRDFIITISFQRAADEFLSKHLEEAKNRLKDDFDGKEGDAIEFEGYTIYPEELQNYNRLSILIDFQILLIETYPSNKSSFYQLLSQILQTLLNESTYAVDKFWYYLESRKTIIQEKIFDKQVTSDRISFLEICNSLTDKFFHKNIQGKRDLTKKDTFNDTFQFRVRMFIGNIFNFEDNTGLNKYFSTSNRIVNDYAATSRARDDSFVKDVIQINKLFRDPYYFLKLTNHKLLTRTADTLKKVYEYLMEEEISWSRVAPKIDQFAVCPPKSEVEKHHLEEKYNNKLYFPENYPLAPFDERKRGDEFEALKKQDQSFMSKQFDDSKIRQTCLVQIYFLCHLYYELNATNKKEFLRSLKGPSNVKHVTDDSPPDSLVSLFFKIKREIPKRYRSIDSQFSFLLQHMAIDETYWWGWLIYGKDPVTGKLLFSDKVLTAAELDIVKQKSETIIPFKEKRYFNNYVTPQLSRKMKIERGLQKLLKEDSDIIGDWQSKIDDLTEKINNSQDPSERDQLVNDRNVITWKHLKRERQSKWLQFGKLLNKQMLCAEVKEPIPTHGETPVEPEADQNVEDNKGTPILQDDESKIEQGSESESKDDSKDDSKDESTKDPNTSVTDGDINNESGGTKRSLSVDDDNVVNDEHAAKRAKK